MIKSKNGYTLRQYSVVMDKYGRILCVEEVVDGKVKCRNGGVFIYWNAEDLTSVSYKEDLL